MHIVLTGALPDAKVARALLPQLTQTAPALTYWLARGHAHIHTVPDSQQTGCTAEEWWRLRLNAYQARPQQTCAAGLGVLRAYELAGGLSDRHAGLDPDQPVWLAELVHIAPTQHGASLLPASELHINAEQDHALFDSLRVLGNSGEFTLHRLQPGLWRVQVAPDFALPCASPALLARSAVNDWWPQQQATRGWRRLFNEVQMLWFDHPVNQQRQQQGLPAINGLWLFGGATASQFAALGAHADCRWHDDLLPSFVRQDWEQWLQTLTRLDAQVFRAIAKATPLRLDLVGTSRVVELAIGRSPTWRTRFEQWMGITQPWTKWWLQD